LDADHPENGVLIPRLFTCRGPHAGRHADLSSLRNSRLASVTDPRTVLV